VAVAAAHLLLAVVARVEPAAHPTQIAAWLADAKSGEKVSREALLQAAEALRRILVSKELGELMSEESRSAHRSLLVEVEAAATVA
jgi:hypothetical protein